MQDPWSLEDKKEPLPASGDSEPKSLPQEPQGEPAPPLQAHPPQPVESKASADSAISASQVAFPVQEFSAWFDKQIEQAHEALDLFQGASRASASNQAEFQAEQALEEQPKQDDRFLWKILIFVAVGLAALAVAAPFIRKFLGGQGDDSGWRYGRSGPRPPMEGPAGEANIPEPSSNEVPETAKPRMQDLAAMVLGKW